jgi:hypothetical protein
MRFGGQFSVQGEEPLLWLHCSQMLRETDIGSPVGVHQEHGIWKCTSKDVIHAIGQGSARPEEFLVISGVSVWEKNIVGPKRGIEGEIELGKFEMIPSSMREDVWSVLLRQQEVLTKMNFNSNLALAEEAWTTASSKSNGQSSNGESRKPIGGLGEGFDEEDDSLVFKSTVKVSKLSDDALRSWCATFLLGLPNLGR